MADQPFPWRKTFILGFGFFGISIIWPLFNSLIPPMLEDLGLAATVIGFIMTWDNIIKMFAPARLRQDAAGPLHALDPAPHDPDRGAGCHPHLLRGRHCAACPATCR
jgi:hypothetical protein